MGSGSLRLGSQHPVGSSEPLIPEIIGNYELFRWGRPSFNAEGMVMQS